MSTDNRIIVLLTRYNVSGTENEWTDPFELREDQYCACSLDDGTGAETFESVDELFEELQSTPLDRAVIFLNGYHSRYENVDNIQSDFNTLYNKLGETVILFAIHRPGDSTFYNTMAQKAKEQGNRVIVSRYSSTDKEVYQTFVESVKNHTKDDKGFDFAWDYLITKSAQKVDLSLIKHRIHRLFGSVDIDLQELHSMAKEEKAFSPSEFWQEISQIHRDINWEHRFAELDRLIGADFKEVPERLMTMTGNAKDFLATAFGKAGSFDIFEHSLDKKANPVHEWLMALDDWLNKEAGE